jgi:hypothetical protein
MNVLTLKQLLCKSSGARTFFLGWLFDLNYSASVKCNVQIASGPCRLIIPTGTVEHDQYDLIDHPSLPVQGKGKTRYR